MRSNRRSAGSGVDQCGTIQVVNKRASEETPDLSCKMYHLMRTRERMYDDGERCGRLWGGFFFLSWSGAVRFWAPQRSESLVSAKIARAGAMERLFQAQGPSNPEAKRREWIAILEQRT
jgi:hypothetical protein